jgi:lysophospholipase L1-like esterase
MVAGSFNPWLKGQSDFMPGMLAHDFAIGGSPERFLRRIQDLCRSAGARLIVAYVPFCGVVHPRYATSLIKVGMRPSIAGALSRDPIFRRQNHFLASLCAALNLQMADATEDLIEAERGVPQYWSFDTHPRPAGYATIARRIRRALRDDDQKARRNVRDVDVR